MDKDTLTDRDGTRPIGTYLPDDTVTLTLTRREADIVALANPGQRPPKALEEIHPWLPDCHYLNDSASNYRQAEASVRKYGPHFVDASDYTNKQWANICNVLRRRNVHDGRFYTAWHLPIQETHVLEEIRADRSIIAIDFNAMYPACMQQSFPKPDELHIVQLNRDLVDGENLAVGLYRCILDGQKSDFIKLHNPFRSFNSGRYLRTSLADSISIDLNEFELAFYQRHFSKIWLVDAAVSNQAIPHPLAKKVRRAFARRNNYVAQGNKPLAAREKYLSALMTSCGSRFARPSRVHVDQDAALIEARRLYGIEIPSSEPWAVTERWIDDRKGVSIRECDGGFRLQGPSPRDGSACHLLGQRIVARSRVMMLEMMERIVASAPEVIICYANTDSIHFSVPTAHLDLVKTWLESEACDEMGSFKIEAIAQHGLWLEPGRYWLYSDEAVVKFKNRGVRHRQDPFRDHAIHVSNRLIGDLSVPIQTTLRMDRTMSASRTLEYAASGELVDQRMIETTDATTFIEVLDQLAHNRRYAIPVRLQAFNRLRKKLNFPAALPRCRKP